MSLVFHIRYRHQVNLVDPIPWLEGQESIEVADVYRVITGSSSDDVGLSGQDFIVGKEPFRSCLVDVKFVSKETLSCLCLTVDVFEGDIEFI